jgi:hypothetical protein
MAATSLYILASIGLWYAAKRDSREEIADLKRDLKLARRKEREAWELGYKAGETNGGVNRVIKDLYRDTT